MLYAEDLSREIIGAAIEVHRELGPGLLESAYEECLCHELSLRGIKFQRQLELPVPYKGLLLDCLYKLDVLVEDQIIVEVKSVETVIPVFQAQLMTHLKLAKKKLGFLMNFNVVLMKDGIKRVIM